MELDQLKDQRILAVDLDGTLLRSDMLFESFWSATSRDWHAPLGAAFALAGGRAALKRSLAGRMDIDVTTLPYDPQVIDYINAWRSEGGTVFLVTASDETIAQEIAQHLDIFDGVYGSNGVRNLKSSEKAAFLTDQFGRGGYAYMGDAEADLPVWESANRAVTVNLPAPLRQRVDGLGLEVEHLSTAQPGLRDYLKAIRVHQWLKNLLVFLPMLAAHQLDAETFLQSLLAFVVFSIVASSIYVLNDLLDLRSDRAHPTKCKRPFAAGTIPIAHATYLIAALMGLGLILSLFLGRAFIGIMLLYVVVTTLYSLWLKRKAIMDIGTLAALYTTRIIAGAVATGITLSMWLLAFSIFFFLSLAIVKRQAELMDSAARGKLKAAGRGYVVDDLPVLVMMAVASGYVAVLVMALYIQSPSVSELYTNPKFLGAICGILLYWISRVILLAHRGQMHEDPVVFAARDRQSRICAILIILVAAGGTLL
ncbi:UbiA family prenyltransferase (plasmid) [Ruegeria sp. SCSIO 43209]|uniref:UbiA family prenyltransferase n=1 Tax=Ruegeria sp. SCSIO 43209 TaxID=2793010 RepID=UPI001CA8C130|nr:UbiA family prenyltransferase [Ruegeria sp. SCSIO 43209]UAB91777.1 UbiA family prenyltransferase [Ruegeria sp. SCSIO 43209]